jgi:hypothetical protein
LTKIFGGGLFWHFSRAGGLMRQKFENSKQPPQLLTNRKTTDSFQIAQIAALMIRFSRVNEFPDNRTRYQGI